MSDDGPLHEETDDADAAPRRGRSLLLVALLGLVTVVAVVVAVIQTGARADLQDEVDRRADAAEVAARFAERLLSYDHEELDAQVDDIAELATADFADEYRDALDAGLGASIRELEATSTATVNEVLSAQESGGRARVVVVVDSEISSDAGTRAAVDTYLDIELLYLDGRWQVDDVQTIANQGGVPAAPDDAATTSTTATTAPG